MWWMIVEVMVVIKTMTQGKKIGRRRKGIVACTVAVESYKFYHIPVDAMKRSRSLTLNHEWEAIWDRVFISSSQHPLECIKVETPTEPECPIHITKTHCP